MYISEKEKLVRDDFKFLNSVNKRFKIHKVK